MKDKANKGYWQRLAKIYAPLMESDKKFYNAICGYIRDYLKLDIENPIIRINTAFKGCSSLEKISVLPRIYHN